MQRKVVVQNAQHAVAVACDAAQADQHIHVRTTAAQGRNRAHMKARAHDKHRRRCQRPFGNLVQREAQYLHSIDKASAQAPATTSPARPHLRRREQLRRGTCAHVETRANDKHCRRCRRPLADFVERKAWHLQHHLINNKGHGTSCANKQCPQRRQSRTDTRFKAACTVNTE